ncbi:class I SAM-dependent methyltransferase [Bacillus sp. EB106-08-02-XG196]|jgi:ubiquinone/menaquinone biosynthesis C-methylase UbiE|uniref:class I SAM-dependent methyltransferase n=1 Tax=Bacillus sp. EB106-08-02-XG196 TaxID=2737049 RepID=UPI0015C4A605|nr:class I SAM-dependent methyltransferase [Bacillus sp. EB106-08-02-XG196]NWQ42297.1 class I SAM-dependent methyltransferase [Bacillus sp. EB106-08-02-XG196]
MRPIDFGQVAKSYARSREDIPVSLMDSLYIRNIIFAGRKVADLGCGSGALTRKMAMRKADVIGVEPSKELLEQAGILNKAKNYIIPYVQGTAEDTKLQDSQFDMVTIMRAWHWFDRPRALQEIKRILKAKGILLVIDSRFLPGSEVVERTFNVLRKYVDGGLKPAGAKAESKQRINGFPVEWFDEWQMNGFDLSDFYKLNYSVTFSKQAWVERMESVSWLAGLEMDIREKALNELFESLSDLSEPFVIPHDCNVCILRLKE